MQTYIKSAVLVALFLSATHISLADELDRSDFNILAGKPKGPSLIARITADEAAKMPILPKEVDTVRDVCYTWSYADACALLIKTDKPFIICKGCKAMDCSSGVCKPSNEMQTVCRRWAERGYKVVCVDGDPYYDDIPDGEYVVVNRGGQPAYEKPVYRTVVRQQMPVFQGGFNGYAPYNGGTYGGYSGYGSFGGFSGGGSSGGSCRSGG